jgi:hypothetical protein
MGKRDFPGFGGGENGEKEGIVYVYILNELKRSD